MKDAEYENMYQVEDIHWWYRGLRNHVQAALPQSRRLRILDVGCGTGATLAMLSPENDVAGIDYSSLALERSRRRGLRALTQGDALALPYPPDSFDALLMLDLLYHSRVNDRAAALREAVRVLVPGGRIVLNLPAYAWLRSSHDEAIQTAHRFTRREVKILLQEAGLRIRRLTYWNTLLFPPILLVRMLRRKPSKRGSDIEGYKHGLAERVFGAILAAERTLLRVVNLPFGLSIFAVAEKTAD